MTPVTGINCLFAVCFLCRHHQQHYIYSHLLQKKWKRKTKNTDTDTTSFVVALVAVCLCVNVLNGAVCPRAVWLVKVSKSHHFECGSWRSHLFLLLLLLLVLLLLLWILYFLIFESIWTLHIHPYWWYSPFGVAVCFVLLLLCALFECVFYFSWEETFLCVAVVSHLSLSHPCWCVVCKTNPTIFFVCVVNSKCSVVVCLLSGRE